MFEIRRPSRIKHTQRSAHDATKTVPPKATPIRPMRTGFQRVAQVLSDTLMREMPHAPQQIQPQTCRLF